MPLARTLELFLIWPNAHCKLDIIEILADKLEASGIPFVKA